MEFLAPYWNFLLVHPILSLLVGAYDLTKDFGFAVVLVTVGIRLVLYPLFVTQIRNQRAMQEIAPAMNEIKAKYGKDRERLTQEQMKLYKERGYNPAMGCLPLLLQMPLLFAMYAAFLFFVRNPPPTGAELGAAIWPFLPNPVAPEQTLPLAANWLPWIPAGLGQPDPLHILPILAGVSQLIASVMAQPAIAPKTVDPQQKMMQNMAYYFPLVTVFIAWSLPAGLAIYWVTTTVFGIVQQYFVTGWGQLPRFVPVLRTLSSPGDRALAIRQQATIVEARQDMQAVGARPDGPGAQRARDHGRERNRRRRKK